MIISGWYILLLLQLVSHVCIVGDARRKGVYNTACKSCCAGPTKFARSRPLEAKCALAKKLRAHVA